MLLLLPPSETKRPGGTRTPLALERLALPGLTRARTQTIDALETLAQDEDASMRVLGLGATQRDKVRVNASIRTSPTLPAVDRNTGVLYDALDAGSLAAPARRWLGAHAFIHTAAFGPVRALDRIPDFRLGAGVSLPGLPPLRRVWAEPVTEALTAAAPRFVVDLRSEAYRELGPVPAGIASVYIRVVADGPDGTVRALNHFNKHAKGVLARRLAETRPRTASAAGLCAWADTAGLILRAGAVPNELELVDPRT